MKLKIINNDLLKVIVGGNNCSCVARNGLIYESIELSNNECEIYCCGKAYISIYYQQIYFWNDEKYSCVNKTSKPHNIYKQYTQLMPYFRSLGYSVL